jgi:hypothetical protein
MNTREIAPSLATLFSELVNGAPSVGPYMLNHDDPGLLRSLDALSASAASAATGGGSSIAAHVDHVRYGLALTNRWASGEQDPWKDADWTASWRKQRVSDAEWAALRAALRDEAVGLLEAMRTPREMSEFELNNVIGIIAHLAYHLGAIRQIDRATRGPSAND